MNRSQSIVVALACAAQVLSSSEAHGQGNKFEDLQNQLDALEARVAAVEGRTQPLVLTVDCAAGQTVAGALAQAARTFRVARIIIDGLCQESVTINRDDIILEGGSAGDGLQAPAPTATVLRISRAHRITLRQLTVSGGNVGLSTDGGSFAAFDLHVTGSAFDGVRVDQGGSGSLMNSVVENAGNIGVAVGSGGSVAVRGTGSVIQNNGFAGLNAGAGGQVSLLDGATVSGNQLGILGFAGGIVVVREGAIVENNTGNGIELAIGSTLNLSTGAIVRLNGGHGVSLRDISVAELGDPTNPPQVINNGRHGIICAPAPGVAQLGVGVATVSGNTQGQVNCPVAPLP